MTDEVSMICPSCGKPLDRTKPGEAVCSPMSCDAWVFESRWDHERRQWVSVTVGEARSAKS